MTTNVYYWKKVPNWGDRLGLELLTHFTGKAARWSEMEFADVLVTGSTVDQIPSGWQGTVAGAGLLQQDCHAMLQQANVMGVRGPLTRERITCANKSSVVLGDPGLLGDDLVDIFTRDRALGILPHWRDTELQNVGIFQQYNPLLISPFESPKTVISSIGRCEKIVTSSLHGLILADSFGLPRRYERNPFSVPAEGGMFKLHDYSASIGLPLQVGVTQQADRNRINDMKSELFHMFDELRPVLP